MQIILWSGLSLVAVLLASFGTWLLSLRAAPSSRAAPPIITEEAAATIAVRRRGGRHDRRFEVTQTPSPAHRDHRYQ
jgi:hypothetical protein